MREVERKWRAPCSVFYNAGHIASDSGEAAIQATAPFTEQGEPGEAFQAHRAKLEASLVYSKEVTGSEEARAIGISGSVSLEI